MSSNGSKDTEAAIKRLNSAVDSALGEIDRLRGELSKARSHNAELEDMLKGITSGERSPAQMMLELEKAQEQNGDMRERLEQGRDAVDRLLAKIRFLEEQG